MPHLPSLLMMTLMFSIKAPLTDISIAGPHELESMCIAELSSAMYVTDSYQCSDESDDTECDALPAPESNTTSTHITLRDDLGKMNKCI